MEAATKDPRHAGSVSWSWLAPARASIPRPSTHPTLCALSHSTLVLRDSGETKDEHLIQKLQRYQGEKASQITNAQGGDGQTLRDGNVLQIAGSHLSKLDPMPVLLPSVVFGKGKIGIAQVAVGYSHTVLLTSEGGVMTFGDGECKFSESSRCKRESNQWNQPSE